jgi:hypothetical protein
MPRAALASEMLVADRSNASVEAIWDQIRSVASTRFLKRQLSFPVSMISQ